MTEGRRGDALTEWTFYNPCVVHHASTFIQKLQVNKSKRAAGDPTVTKTGSDGLKGRVLLKHQRVQDLKMHLAEMGLAHDSKGRDTVQILYQRHGDMMHVPAGWPHQVVNLKPCVKMAWDFFTSANMSRYALSWLYISKQMPRSDDYMGAAIVLKNAITNLYHE